MEPGRETARDLRQKEPVGWRVEPEEVIRSGRKRSPAEIEKRIGDRRGTVGGELFLEEVVIWKVISGSFYVFYTTLGYPAKPALIEALSC